MAVADARQGAEAHELHEQLVRSELVRPFLQHRDGSSEALTRHCMEEVRMGRLQMLRDGADVGRRPGSCRPRDAHARHGAERPEQCAQTSHRSARASTGSRPAKKSAAESSTARSG
jgi:hypothetical protein